MKPYEFYFLDPHLVSIDWQAREVGRWRCSFANDGQYHFQKREKINELRDPRGTPMPSQGWIDTFTSRYEKCQINQGYDRTYVLGQLLTVTRSP